MTPVYGKEICGKYISFSVDREPSVLQCSAEKRLTRKKVVSTLLFAFKKDRRKKGRLRKKGKTNKTERENSQWKG